MKIMNLIKNKSNRDNINYKCKTYKEYRRFSIFAQVHGNSYLTLVMRFYYTIFFLGHNQIRYNKTLSQFDHRTI